MRPIRSAFPKAVTLSAVAVLIGVFPACGVVSSSTSPVVTFSVQPTTNVGASQTLSATVVNGDPANIHFGISGLSTNAIPSPGTVTMVNGVYTYTAPAIVPTYSAADLAHGAQNGKVDLAAVYTVNQITSAVTSATTTILGPVVTGISPTSATVAHSATQQFTAFAVGNLNTGLIWQVNGVTGGNTANGSVSATGLYTAPLAIPVTGPTVTVTAVSAADQTKSSSATVTIN